MASADDLKAKGNAAFQEKRFDEAIEHFTNAIEIAPDNHVLYSNRSAAYASAGSFHQALADADKVIELKQDWPKGYNRKGAALIGLQRQDEALDTYKVGLERCPGDSALQSALQDLESQLKMEEDQMGANLWAQLAPMLGGLRDPNLREKLRKEPTTMAFADQPDFAAMLAAVQANPQQLGSFLKDDRMGAVLNYVMKDGLAQKQAQNPPPSAQSAPPKSEAPKPAAPSKPEPREEIAAELTPEQKIKAEATAAKEEGNRLYKARDFEGALKKYDEAIALEPNEMTHLLNKSAVYLELGKYDESIETAQKSIQVGRAARANYKSVAKAYTRIGNAYMKQEKWDEAISAFQSSLTEDHTDDAARKEKQCKKLKQEHEAKAYLDDDKAEEAKQRGNELFRNGDYTGAILAYEDSLRRRPNTAAVFSNLAACLGKLGQFPRAIESCDACLKIDPTFVKAYTRKAGFQFYLKEYHKAVESYNKALELDANNAEAQDGLMRTRMAMASQGDDEIKDRAKHAMADPEIQAIVSDPIIQNVLKTMQEDPKAAQAYLRDPDISARLQKLVDAGILQLR